MPLQVALGAICVHPSIERSHGDFDLAWNCRIAEHRQKLNIRKKMVRSTSKSKEKQEGQVNYLDVVDATLMLMWSEKDI